MNSAAVFFCKIISFLLAGLFSIGLPVKIHGRPLSGSITVTAHSGCLDLPDNSVEAMKAGVEAGALIIEFDLNFTADGTPVLSHEAPDEDGEYVTLEEAFAFLAEHPGILANVDVKSTEHMEAVPSLAEKAGILDRIFFTGIEEDDIPAVREKCPGIPYYLNMEIQEDDDFQALAEKTASLGAAGININWKSASPGLVSVFHKNGLPVSVWTVNEEEKVLRVALFGVDNITTRRPDIACKLTG